MQKDLSTSEMQPGPDKKHPYISVIVPSYNSMPVLLDCVHSLQNQKTQFLFEIIVVDSSPVDLSKEFQKISPHIKFIHSKKRLFPGEARNIGVRAAAGKIVAFTDADCLVPADWIEGIGRFFQTEEADVLVGAISNAHPENLVSLAEFYVQYREFSEFTKKRNVGILPGGNFAIWKEFYQRIGGFPNYRKAQDTLFARNIFEKNGKMMFIPSLKVFHRNRTNLYFLLKNQYLLGFNSAIVRKISNLPGSYLASSRFFIPFIPFIRMVRTIQFLLKFKGTSKIYAFFELNFVFPLLILCISSWSIGFSIALNRNSK